VVPTPMSSSSPLLMLPTPTPRLAMTTKARPTTMIVTLLSTGAHIGAANLRRAFSDEPHTALTPRKKICGMKM
jgi:hypothetical protein